MTGPQQQALDRAIRSMPELLFIARYSARHQDGGYDPLPRALWEWQEDIKQRYRAELAFPELRVRIVGDATALQILGR